MKKTKNELPIVPSERIISKILLIRGKKVMLDKDLAILYGVKPIRLREQVKRNIKRFPEDFMFQLNKREIDFMVSQNAIPPLKYFGGYLPYVFTEQGVAMLSSVLNSERAILVNIQIIRTFTKLKELLATHTKLRLKIESMEKKYDIKLRQVFDILKKLLVQEAKPKGQMGFNKGFTLVETLVALSIFTTSIVALIVVTSSGVANTNFAKNKLTASYLAQEGIELVRNIRDSNVLGNRTWLVGLDNCIKGNGNLGCNIDASVSLVASACATEEECRLYYDDSTGYFGTNSSLTKSPFLRLITVENRGIDENGAIYEVKVTSTVSWRQGGTPTLKSVTMSENLFNWASSTALPTL